MEVGERAGADDGLEDELVGFGEGGGLLYEGEAGEGVEVKQEVGDCGEVGYVEVDEREGTEVLRRRRAGEVGKTAVGDALEILEPEGLEGREVLKCYVVEIVNVEVGYAEVLEGGELVEDGGENVAFENAAVVGMKEESCK